MFTAFGAAPTSINFSEVYTALQTGVVDGQENPLAILSNFKLWEVQKYVSMTNHMWDGFWMLPNRRSWGAVPDDLKEIVATNFNASAVEQRADIEALNATLQGELEANGMVFNAPDTGALPAEARRRRLLCRVEGQVRRRRLGDPRGRHRADARLIAHGRRDDDAAHGFSATASRSPAPSPSSGR